MATDETTLPFVSCLCPTYRRPVLLQNVIACFLKQDYPAARRELVVLDDAAQLGSQCGDGWEIVSIRRRFRSLPEKYNALAALSGGEIIVTWEDDDIYLPWHISAHVRALGAAGFSKPSKVRSLYTGKLAEQNAGGLFHGSIAFTRSHFDAVDGWPITHRGDFDQQFITRLGKQGRADPCNWYSPSYVFRWASTQQYHGQAFMSGPADTNWYDRCGALGHAPSSSMIVPEFDKETSDVISSVTSDL